MTREARRRKDGTLIYRCTCFITGFFLMSLYWRTYTLKSGRISRTAYYDFEHKKRRYRGSFGHCTKTKARQLYESLKTSIREGRYQPMPEPEPTVADFLTEFLEDYRHSHKPGSTARHGYSARALLPVFGRTLLSQITHRQVDGYIRGRIAQGRSAVTVNREIGLLSALLNTAVRWGKIPRSPLAHLKKLRELPRQRIVTDAEEERLLLASPEPLRGVVMLALDTGFRESELVSLTARSVNREHRLLTVINAYAKTGETRTVECTDRAWRVIEWALSLTPSSSAGRQPLLGYTRAASIKRAFRRAANAAELPDVRFHDLRHTFATRLLLDGEDLVKVQHLLGHKTVQMTMRYLTLTGGDTRGILAGRIRVGLPPKSPTAADSKMARRSET